MWRLIFGLLIVSLISAPVWARIEPETSFRQGTAPDIHMSYGSEKVERGNIGFSSLRVRSASDSSRVSAFELSRGLFFYPLLKEEDEPQSWDDLGVTLWTGYQMNLAARVSLPITVSLLGGLGFSMPREVPVDFEELWEKEAADEKGLDQQSLRLSSLMGRAMGLNYGVEMLVSFRLNHFVSLSLGKQWIWGQARSSPKWIYYKWDDATGKADDRSGKTSFVYEYDYSPLYLGISTTYF